MLPEKRKASPTRTTTQNNDSNRVAWAVALGCAVRLGILALFPDIVEHYLAGRVELSTPVTSYKRLREGLFLSANRIPPFDGGIFHQSPLLLLVFGILHRLPEFFTSLAYVAADGFVALMLARIAASRRARDTGGSPLVVPGEIAFSCAPSVVATLYLFNPLTLATVLVKSTIVFSHLAIAVALCAAAEGRLSTAALWAAVATHLSVYPAMLLAPIALIPSVPASHKLSLQGGGGGLPRRIATAVAIFALAFGAMHLLFIACFGMQYFTATFDFVLRVADLQPNVGLFWYFFIEIFDEFRMFFFVVFQLTALAFAVPVAWRFRADPLFAATMLVGIISALKSYPSWGDLALFLGLLPIFEELFKYMQYMFLSANMLLYGIGLAPVFWHLWIEQGSGNANFFYAATLVYVFGQITLLFDLGSAMLRRELDIHHPETRTRPVIQE
ncbi:hypothetical protein GGI22_001212 [Coemansia erecta]|nr:hypothetical protein GGI22_001212 [Coemansia erecta]